MVALLLFLFHLLSDQNLNFHWVLNPHCTFVIKKKKLKGRKRKKKEEERNMKEIEFVILWVFLYLNTLMLNA